MPKVVERCFFEGSKVAMALHLDWNLKVDNGDAQEIVDYIFDRVINRVDSIFPDKTDAKYAAAFAGLLTDAASCAQRIFAAKLGRPVGELSGEWPWPLQQKRFTDPFLIAMQQEVAEMEAEAMEGEGRLGPLV